MKAVIEIPAGQGKLVYAAWDFDASGTFNDVVDLSKCKISKNGLHVEITKKQVFKKSGTHFPVLRIASQREGDAKTPYTLIKNLDRVRVVVK